MWLVSCAVVLDTLARATRPEPETGGLGSVGVERGRVLVLELGFVLELVLALVLVLVLISVLVSVLALVLVLVSALDFGNHINHAN